MSGFGFMSGQQIYDNFQQGVGPEGLSGSAAMVNEMAARYQERAKRVHQLKTRMETVWQGDASGAAQRGVGPLVTEHDSAGHALGVAQNLTGGQAGSFSNSKNQVVLVPDAPTSVDPLAMLTDPGAVVTAMEQVQAHNDASQHNVDVMNRYASVSQTNTQGQPESFGTLTDNQSGVSVGSPSSGSIDSDDYRESDSDSETGSGPVGGDGSPGTGADGVTPHRQDVPSGQSSSGDAGATTPGAFTPTPNTGPLTTDGMSNAGRPMGGSVAGLGFGVTPVGGPGGSGAPRGGGFPRGAPRAGFPVGGVGAQEPGAAGRSGGVPPYGSSGPGRGGMGFGGAPIGGVGRGKSEEDQERKTPPYLEGGDPDELFDTDLLTAPPVIGGPDDE